MVTKYFFIKLFVNIATSLDFIIIIITFDITNNEFIFINVIIIFININEIIPHFNFIS
jgi:hypothetical protein